MDLHQPLRPVARGLLTAAVSGQGDPATVTVALDVELHRFLRDHLVDGRPLLSTVMGIEAMACAVAAARPGTRITAVSDVVVGPPYFVPPGGGQVEIVITGEQRVRCEVFGGAPEPCFTAVVLLGDDPIRPAVGPTPGREAVPGPAVDGATVYGLYFHGESFRVIGSASRSGELICATLAPDLPAVVQPGRPSLTAPLLIELCLQAAGLGDLVELDAMTIPHRIGSVRRLSAADPPFDGTLTAYVKPGAGEGGRAFDAVVADGSGAVHLELRGYRTTPFGHPFDRAAAERIRAALTGRVSPAG